MEFVIIPTKVLISDKLSDKAKIVYFLLNKYAYDKITCYPSIQTMKEELDVTKITISRALEELRKYGLIKVYREATFSHNNYIIIPVEWLDFKEVGEEEYYIENKEEYSNLCEKIKLYYEEYGIEITSKKKKKGNRKVKTPQDIINEIDGKIVEGEVLTIGDYAKYMFKRVYEEYGQVISYSGVKVNSIFKKLFEGKDKDEVLLIIDCFVEMYEANFKREGFEMPLPQYLGVTWIYNKVINRVNAKKRDMTEVEELDITF